MITQTSNCAQLSSDLDSIAKEIATACGMEKIPEMHAHEVFQGKGIWKLEPALRKHRSDFLIKVCELVVSSDVTLVLQGINRQRHTKQYANPLPPHEVLMMFSLERINEYARRHDTTSDVIADHIHMQGRLQRNLSSYKTDATWGYKAQRLDSITSLEFARSDDHGLIQTADLVAYLARREYVVRHKGSTERLTEYLWKILQPNIKVWRIWP